MAELLVLIETYQQWLYMLLALVGMIYLRLAIRWWTEYRKAIFGLERERAITGLRGALAVLILLISLAAGTFVAANFVGPALPMTARPTVLPTVSLLATDSPEAMAEEGGPPATGIPQGTADASGCANPLATVLAPGPGEVLSGIVDIEGTANIENFAFYKYEFRLANTEDVWQAISAGTNPVVDGLLGTWDTSLVPASDYDFRLVVTDTAGNAPLPCEFQVRIIPSESG